MKELVFPPGRTHAYRAYTCLGVVTATNVTQNNSALIHSNQKKEAPIRKIKLALSRMIIHSLRQKCGFSGVLGIRAPGVQCSAACTARTVGACAKFQTLPKKTEEKPRNPSARIVCIPPSLPPLVSSPHPSPSLQKSKYYISPPAQSPAAHLPTSPRRRNELKN